MLIFLFHFIASFAFVLQTRRAKPIPLVGRCLGAAVAPNLSLRRDASIFRFAQCQVCFANIAPALRCIHIITQIGRESKSDIPTSSEWYCRPRDSDMKACGFRDILFSSKTRVANNTRHKPNITAKQYHSPKANKTAELPYEKFGNMTDFFVCCPAEPCIRRNGTLFFQGGALRATLLLPASHSLSGQVNRYKREEVCKPSRFFKLL